MITQVHRIYLNGDFVKIEKKVNNEKGTDVRDKQIKQKKINVDHFKPNSNTHIECFIIVLFYIDHWLQLKQSYYISTAL